LAAAIRKEIPSSLVNEASENNEKRFISVSVLRKMQLVFNLH